MSVHPRIRTRLRRLVPIAAVLSVLLGGTVAASVFTATPASASVGTNDYPWSGAVDCSATYGIYSWCENGNDISPLGFGYRNCTDYAAYELNEQMGGTVSNPQFSYSKFGFSTSTGNAAGWKSQITTDGYTANGTPAVGSVAWWGTEVASGFGHVAIVTGITYNSDGSVNSITTADYNSGDPVVNGSPTWGNYATHTLTPTSGWPDSFLHVADVTSSSSTSAWRAAFQAAGIGELYMFDSTSGTIPTTLGIANGTSPAIAAPYAGYEEAFQASGTGHLYLNGAVTNGDTQQGLYSGSSPAIAALSNSNNYEVAFSAAGSGNLYLYTHTSSGDSVTPTTWGMWPGTSPSIAALNTGGYEIAFQAAGTGHLYVYGPGNDGIIDTGQGMMAGTSPSITGSPGGGYEVAFQTNTGYLYYFYSNHVTVPTNLGMDNSSSPAITASPNGAYETAFEAAGTDHLYLNGYWTTGDTGQGMWPGTSPSITGLTGGYEAVFKAAGSGNLYLYNHTSSGDVITPSTQGVASGTSPSVG